MSEALVLRDYGRLTFEITSEAARIRDAALEQSALISVVENADQNEAAVFAQRELKRVAKLFEDARKAVKQPIIEYGRLIDAKTAEAVKEVEMELARVSTEIGNFQQAELEKVRAEQRRIAEEQERIERERQAELKRIADEQAAAEREARRKAEEEAKAARNKAEAEAAEKRRLEMEAAIAKRAEEEKAKAEQAAAFSQECIKPMEAPTKAAGQVVKTDWEITKINEFLLMKARPDLVRKIEFDTLAIKSELRRGMKLPGVEAREVVTSTTRVSAKGGLIEV